METLLAALLLVPCHLVGSGWQQGQGTPRVIHPVVTAPEAAMPAADRPSQDNRPSDPTIVSSVKHSYRPAVPDEDKAALIYQGGLDRLRILICSDEKMMVDGKAHEADVARQAVCEHFADLGFRVLDGATCPASTASLPEWTGLAETYKVDLLVLLRGTSKQVDKLGNFYSFEADGRAKVVRIGSAELLTTQSAFVRGKRALNDQRAARSALAVCGNELAKKLSDEILRKSVRWGLVRRRDPVAVDSHERRGLDF